jgi:hypothetical protein
MDGKGKCQMLRPDPFTHGILIPFAGEQAEEDNVRKLEGQSHIYIANDLLHAAEFIVARNE